MFKLLFTIMCFILFLTPAARGAEFTLTNDEGHSIWYEYTGYVELGDARKLREIMDNSGGKFVFIVINSGGGSAYGGVSLFWEAERWSNLVTMAGRDYGAWSAAAIFWLGSPYDFHQGEKAKVGFHAAYCDPWNPPGCDTRHFQRELIRVFDRCGWHGVLFNYYLNRLQEQGGVSGWLVLKDDGWSYYHSILKTTWEIPVDWIRKDYIT